jgi:hypothetical protein
VFGLDSLTEPRLADWVVHPDDLDDLDDAVDLARGHGYDPGEIRALSRRAPAGTLLSWRLTRSEALSVGGLVPFLIDWGTCEHPHVPGCPGYAWSRLRPRIRIRLPWRTISPRSESTFPWRPARSRS